MTNLPTTIGPEIYEASIADLQSAMEAGRVTARRLVEACLERIAAVDQAGPQLRSVLETNPDALLIAESLDEERAVHGPRGPLHGLPILLKDNIDTNDAMATTAGSLALLGTRVDSDATVARRLREAGAVLLGKANLSEWANFRSTRSTSGWSGRGRQTRNPYVLDRNPGGSSAGSAVAVAASLCAAALGSETDGSIICPSALCGVVGLKPTVGLLSRAGVIPISSTQDTLGPHGRSVTDVATLLGPLVGPDVRDGATAASAGHTYDDYRQFLQAGGLEGARIGVLRDRGMVGYNPFADGAFEQALQVLARQGATLIDPVSLHDGGNYLEGDEFTVLLYDFKHDLNAYLATRRAGSSGVEPPRSLAELIAFNQQHEAQEMPYFGQELFHMAQAKGPLSETEYQEALARSRDGTRTAINQLLVEQQLDALVAPSMPPAWVSDLLNGDKLSDGCTAPAARAGYPLINVPAGMIYGLPLGITFMGGAWSEPVLLRLAYAYEQATRLRIPPGYVPTAELV
jgi:amidase